MKLKDYIKEKGLFIILYTFLLLLSILLMFSFKLNKSLLFLIMSINIIFICLYFVRDYLNKKKFYDNFYKTLSLLDKKYLIHEIITDGDFLESKILLEYLYEIDKSYSDDINDYKHSLEEFKEYLELWCHEIKTPISTSKLIINNNKNKVTLSIDEEIDKMEYYVEQVLYYARCENVEKDYIIAKVSLKDLINSVVKNNKKDLINKKIKMKTLKENVIVESDSKWLLYIINQILLNSIKYSKKDNPIIKFDYKKNSNNIVLTIEDNGIGIPKSDIKRVFDKGFTGTNGRINVKSTGMGLYLCKRMCERLGHGISISSNENEGTKLQIVFPINKILQ